MRNRKINEILYYLKQKFSALINKFWSPTMNYEPNQT